MGDQVDNKENSKTAAKRAAEQEALIKSLNEQYKSGEIEKFIPKYPLYESPTPKKECAFKVGDRVECEHIGRVIEIRPGDGWECLIKWDGDVEPPSWEKQLWLIPVEAAK